MDSAQTTCSPWTGGANVTHAAMQHLINHVAKRHIYRKLFPLQASEEGFSLFLQTKGTKTMNIYNINYLIIFGK